MGKVFINVCHSEQVRCSRPCRVAPHSYMCHAVLRPLPTPCVVACEASRASQAHRPCGIVGPVQHAIRVAPSEEFFFARSTLECSCRANADIDEVAGHSRCARCTRLSLTPIAYTSVQIDKPEAAVVTNPATGQQGQSWSLPHLCSPAPKEEKDKSGHK